MSKSVSEQQTEDGVRSGTRTVAALAPRFEAALANPVVAYAGIILLQLRPIWNVWRYKDLTYGDTAGYYTLAIGWWNALRDHIDWSPLYTNFFGTVVGIFGSVYAGEIAHRIAIVFAATLLVLALMRSLLGPTIGFLIAAWWAVLPPNYNVLYEVHLFGLLPILVAALVVRRNPGRGALGLALAILALSTLLLRNEMLIATVVLGIGIVVHEVRARRAERVPAGAYLKAYGLPLLVVLLLFGGAYWRSYLHGHAALEVFRTKHTLNVCQVYAFSYQQRHPQRFRGSPFTDCAPLMKREFGKDMPSLLQATAANPGAIARFVGWNVRLLGSGLQVALFGATATGDNPDYPPPPRHRNYTIPLSILMVAIVVAGLVAIRRDRRFWRSSWFAPRKWCVTVLAGVSLTTVVVVLTQRPRPEYMFPLTVSILALIGVCVSALLRRSGFVRWAAPVVAVTAVVLFAAMPTYYHPGPRPIHDGLARLQVARNDLQAGTILVASGYGTELCSYLARGGDSHCEPADWAAIASKLDAGEPLPRILERVRATAIYVDPTMGRLPAVRKLLAAPTRVGWRKVSSGAGADGSWAVLLRKGVAGA